jgi:putative inorganic carbon (HCO3(-)) transporter
MAMTVAVSAPSQSPTVVSFGEPPRSCPIRPGHALRWAFVALLAANVGRIPVFANGGARAAIVANDLFVLGLVSFTIIAAVLRRSLWMDAVALFALGFAAIGFGSAIASVHRYGLSPFQLLVSLSYLARWLVYFGLYLFVINNVRPDQVTGIWRSLLTIMLVFAAFGIFQSLFLPGFAQMIYPDSGGVSDWDVQGSRLVSTVLEPNIAASMIVLILLAQLSQIAVGVRVRWWQPTVLVVALAMTLSRSGLLALFAGLLTIVIARGLSKRLLRILGLIAFLSISIMPRIIAFGQAYGRFTVGEGTSAGTRVLSWLLALRTIADHPVFGIGFNTYGFVKESAGISVESWASHGADGGLLFATVMTGLTGLACYLAMLWSVIRRCRRIWRDQAIDAEQRGLAIGISAGIVAVCVHSLFANSLFTTFVMEILWVMWGLTFVIARPARA